MNDPFSDVLGDRRGKSAPSEAELQRQRKALVSDVARSVLDDSLSTRHLEQLNDLRLRTAESLKPVDIPARVERFEQAFKAFQEEAARPRPRRRWFRRWRA